MGKIHGEEVLVIIDNSASHNFISSQVVNKLKLTAINKKFVVTVGDGYRLQGKEICRGVELELQGAHIRQIGSGIGGGMVGVLVRCQD